MLLAVCHAALLVSAAPSQIVSVWNGFDALPQAVVDNAMACEPRNPGRAAGRSMQAVFLHPKNDQPATATWDVTLPPVTADDRLILSAWAGLSDGVKPEEHPMDGVGIGVMLDGKPLNRILVTEPGWAPFAVDLRELAGKAVKLALYTDDGGHGNTSFDWAMLGLPQVVLLRGNALDEGGRGPILCGGALLAFTAAGAGAELRAVPTGADGKPLPGALTLPLKGDGLAYLDFDLSRVPGAAGVQVEVSGAKAEQLRAAAHSPGLAIKRVGTRNGVVFHGQPFEVVAVVENTGRAPFTAEHSLNLQFGGVSDVARSVARLNPGETLSVVAPAKPVAAPSMNQVTCTATWHAAPGAAAETARGEGRFRIFAAPAAVPAERAMTRELQVVGDTLVLQNQHARVILAERGGGAVLFEVADGGGYRRLAAAPSLCELYLGDTPADFGKPEVDQVGGGCQIKLPVQGVAATVTVRLRLSPSDGLVNVAVELAAAADLGVRALRGPAVLVGDGGRGEHKLGGLFPGLEYLAADEPSSSTRDFAPALALRLVPDPYKVCIPLMAVESEDGLVGLLWDQTAKWHADQFTASALFASPNFLDGQANHRLQLFVPAGPDLIKENQLLSTAPYALAAGQTMTLEQQVLLRPKGNVLDAVDAWSQINHGLPAPDARPRDFEAELALSRWGFLHSVWNDKTQKSHHCAGWPDANAPNFAALLLADALATQDRAGAAEARRRAELILATTLKEEGEGGLAGNNCCHIMRSVAPFVAGHLDGAYPAIRNAAYGAIGGMGADGSWRYHPDAERTSLGEQGAVELGTCAPSAAAIWRWARMTGDAEAIAAGKRALAFMDRFQVPAGAQGWECPIHEPDILASAYAIRAYVDAFVTTDDAAYLSKAVYWARTGLPFCYLWADPGKPGMRYATIPVFGSTYFTHSWLGLPVQWCGLVYGYALLQLAPYDQSRDWRKVADGITVSGMYQQCTDEQPELKGCYPDSWGQYFTRRNGPFINPEDIVLNDLALRGLDPEVQMAIARSGNERFHISSGARIGDVKLAGRTLRFKLTAPAGALSCTMLPFVAMPATVTLAGKPASTGPDLDAPGVNTTYDGGNAVLFLKVTHGAEPVTVVVDGLRPGQPQAGAPKRRWTFQQGPDGWEADNHCRVAVEDGHMVVSVTGFDPYCHATNARFLAGDHPQVVVRARSTKVARLGLFWGSVTSPGTTSERSLEAALVPDGQWHDVVFDLRGKPGWAGVVDVLRLDPEPADVGDGARLEIEWIEARGN